jgi:phage FluMu gp28-like protein
MYAPPDFLRPVPESPGFQRWTIPCSRFSRIEREGGWAIDIYQFFLHRLWLRLTSVAVERVAVRRGGQWRAIKQGARKEDALEVAKRDPAASLKAYIQRAVVEALTRKTNYDEFIQLANEEWTRWKQEMETSGWEVRNLNDDERLRALVERQKRFSE